MKRTIFTLLIILISSASFAQVAQDCPAVDCPGQCGRFIDQDHDGFCDHGKLSKTAAQEQKVVSEPKEVQETPSENKKSEPTIDNKKQPTAQPEPQKPVPSTEKAIDTSLQEPVNTASSEPETSTPEKKKNPYNLILISALTFGLYLITFCLAQFGTIKKASHHKVWNIVLLITALASCLLGFFLVIQINYGLKMDWLHTVKYYHVQFGIAMTIIAIFHILWHLNYWLNIFNQKHRHE